MNVARRFVGPLIGLGGSAAALLFYLAWQIAHRGSYLYSTSVYHLDDADEWRYTVCSRLVLHGYTMFDQVFSAQPPVLFLALSGGMRAFGGTIGAARTVEVLFGVIALVAVVWITWILAGPVAASASAIVLAVSPGFLIYTRAVEAEGPMMALVSLSLAVALTYRRLRSPWLPAVAGLLLSAAILTKLFAVEALVPGVWALAAVDTSRRLRPALVFVVAALLPAGAEMALVSPAAQWRQVVTLHQQASALALPGSLPPLRILADFLGLDLGLTLLAAAGVAVLLVLALWDDLIFISLWLGGSLLMLLVFRPLFPHHAAILLAPLAVPAGIAVTVWIEQLRSRRWLAALPLSGAVLAYLLLAPRIAHDDRHALVAGVASNQTMLARFIDAHTSSADFVATDDLEAADLANRLVPPRLCDPSNVRFYAGYLTRRTMVQQTLAYRVRLVLPTGIYRQVPGYLAWLRAQYAQLPAPGGIEAYRRRG